MKEKFNTRYIASVSDYDVPLTDDLYKKIDEAVDDVTRANQDGVMTKILKKPGQLLGSLNKTINKFSNYAKDGPTGVLVGLSSNNDNDWINSYNHAKKQNSDSFTYKGKRYKITQDIENLVSKLNPMKRKTR